MDSLILDLRFGTRMLWKSPGYTIVAILTLAIGIGGITAMFSVVNGVLLRPLPYGETDRLVSVRYSVRGARGGPPPSISRVPGAQDWSEQTGSFQDILRYAAGEVILLTDAGPESVKAPVVTTNFTDILKVQPRIGRGFLPEDVTSVSYGASGSVAIVSHGFWTRRLGSNPNAVGTQLKTSRGIVMVIGVMPPAFSFPPLFTEPGDIWLPVRAPIPRQGPPIGRLKAGISLTAAATELNGIIERNKAQYTGTGTEQIQVSALMDSARAGSSGYFSNGPNWASLLKLFLGAVGFILLIALANVANLTLARAVGREREIAIRSAIGSTRFRLMRQLLAESLLLSLLGGILGLLIAYWGVEVIIAALPPAFPRVEEIGIDLNVLGFTLATVLLSALVFGITPALRFSKPALDRMLKESSGHSTESGWSRRFRFLLIGSEVALATILLAGGLLLAKTFVQVIGTPLGMDIDNVITVRIAFPPAKYPAAARRTFLAALSDKIRLQPNVQSVAVSNFSSLSGLTSYPIWQEGRYAEQVQASFLEGSPDIFRILGLQLKSGRGFNEGERGVVITESFARKYFPDKDPLGQQFYLGDSRIQMPVVGVVTDFRHSGLEPAYAQAIILPPAAAASSILVKTAASSSTLMSAIRRELVAMDPQLFATFTTLEEAFAASQPVAQPRFRMAILGSFAAVALALTLVGIYGVTSYAAVRRRQEVGIRMALGGSRRAIMTAMLRQAMLPVLLGTAAGIAGALAVTRLIAGYLAGVSPTDPIVFMATPVILLLTAAVATWLPLRKSTAVDPMIALRDE